MYGFLKDERAPKFKVGQRVRVVDADGGGRVGDVATVTGVDFLDRNDAHIYNLDGLSDGAVCLLERRLVPAFLPGDKVRVTKHSGYFAAGDVGEVESQSADVVYLKHGSYQRLGLPIDADSLELVEAAQPEPKFKVGDRVVTSGVDDAGVGVVLGHNNDGSYSVKFDSWYGTCGEMEGKLSLANPWSSATDTSDYATGISFAQPSPCIVARVVSGTPRPSNIPYVHGSVQAATAEAERLARNNPGKEFAVYQRVAGRMAEVSYSMKEVA